MKGAKNRETARLIASKKVPHPPHFFPRLFFARCSPRRLLYSFRLSLLYELLEQSTQPAAQALFFRFLGEHEDELECGAQVTHIAKGARKVRFSVSIFSHATSPVPRAPRAFRLLRSPWRSPEKRNSGLYYVVVTLSFSFLRSVGLAVIVFEWITPVLQAKATAAVMWAVQGIPGDVGYCFQSCNYIRGRAVLSLYLGSAKPSSVPFCLFVFFFSVIHLFFFQACF